MSSIFDHNFGQPKNLKPDHDNLLLLIICFILVSALYIIKIY